MSTERASDYGVIYWPYIYLAGDTKALTHLDLSHNPLSTGDLKILKKVLQKNTTLTSLSLAGCWPKANLDFQWDPLAAIVAHKSLVCLDLSHNMFLSTAEPVLRAIEGHPSLQRLYLDDIGMTDRLVGTVLPDVLANNTTLLFLRLPQWPDSVYAPLAKAMEKNHILRSLSIPRVEKEYAEMGADSPAQFENYLALMDRISLNHRTWDEKRIALIEGGMTVVMGGMKDAAHYVAPYVYAKGNGDEAMILTLLNKEGHQAGLDALERLQKQG